ncbi:hypothetical protein [Streptomyces sp. SAJ15]|uniref:hypothetical protein n=1 Tax=Streptomyces sp. SAJ15 TaxID=2011095 RepID=UPI001184700D|nr:hypothetical protein [Streptomyces sp. SAJ15]TVL92294.1 hypothetical protein CD790_11315 [Streptomyces sp. SAJ15]
MARIRPARTLAAVAALPLAVALFGGVAHADGDDGAGDGPNKSVGSIVGSGVGDDNNGNSTTTQQIATGTGASNQNNTASVIGAEDVFIDQHNATVVFVPWW